jgi:hypothetical protein
MPGSSARLMVSEGGVEVTIFLTRVSEAGWVAAAPRGRSLPFGAVSVYKGLRIPSENSSSGGEQCQ